jgi:hypothetical protein
MQHLYRRMTLSDRRRANYLSALILEARVGLAREVRQSLAVPEPEWQDQHEYVLWAKGELALAQGHPVEAAPLLTKALDEIRNNQQSLVKAASVAVEASRGPEAALALIAQNMNQPDRTPGSWNASDWVELQARRVHLLRRLGRNAEAEPIEAELRKYLSYADPDVLALRQLGTGKKK